MDIPLSQLTSKVSMVLWTLVNSCGVPARINKLRATSAFSTPPSGKNGAMIVCISMALI